MTSSDCRIRQEVENLAALRIRKGISLSAIEKATKIRVAYLAAIEEGRFTELPDGVYRVNYLKQYAAQIDPVILDRLTTELRHWHDPAGADGEGCSTKRPFWWARRWFPGLAVAVLIGAPVHFACKPPLPLPILALPAGVAMPL